MKKILYHFQVGMFLGMAVLPSIAMPFSAKINSNAESSGINEFENSSQPDSSHDTELEKPNNSNNPNNPNDPNNPNNNDNNVNNPTGSENPSDNDDNDDDNSDPPDDPDTPEPDFQFTSDLIIKAVNPGYTVDGTRDVGEFVELQKLSNTTSFSLAGYAIRYVNNKGKATVLLDFSEGSFLAGETLLMRLARSPGSDQADATYSTTLSMSSGRLELMHDGEIVDTVCWGSKTCLTVFKSNNPTTLVRNMESGDFEHITNYAPFYNSEQPSLILPPEPVGPDETDEPAEPDDEASNDRADAELGSVCAGIELTEIYSYYDKNKTEQFVELHNPTEREIQLDGCILRYKTKSLALSGSLSPDAYRAYYVNQAANFSFTKNPSSSNLIELIDVNKDVVDMLEYPHGQKKSASYAKFYDHTGAENWQITYQITPDGANIYQEFRTCAEGKVINPDTGNCVKATSVNASGETKVKACAEGQYRNPLTGRCKKLATTSEAKPCAEGYERNPETGRCRKIKSANDGADYALIPETYSSKSSFTALGIVLAIIAGGTVYIILQFRREIFRALRKVPQRVHHISKDLVARGRSICRHQKP